MSTIADNLASIAQKLQLVHQKLDTLQRENSRLKQQNQKLNDQLETELRRSQSLQNDYHRLKLAKSVASTTADKAQMKFKVNELVKEIDKCMALLNR